eukprot:11226984-Lingulodinium_polyedra.AAC.1
MHETSRYAACPGHGKRGDPAAGPAVTARRHTLVPPPVLVKGRRGKPRLRGAQTTTRQCTGRCRASGSARNPRRPPATIPRWANAQT